MKRNEGTVDRIVRIVLGIAALVGAIAVGIGTVWGILLLVVAAVLVVTAAVSFCPLYALFGISTCPAPRVGRGSDKVGTAS
jgi:hypothetical protein